MLLAKPCSAAPSNSGGVLLEVVVALVLFALAAAVIGGALNASVASLDRVRAQTHAQDLAVSVVSWIQMGILPPAPAGPEPFDPPFSDWTWELEVTPVGQPALDATEPLLLVEVVVRQLDGLVVQRLAQWLAIPENDEEELVLP